MELRAQQCAEQVEGRRRQFERAMCDYETKRVKRDWKLKNSLLELEE